MLDSLKKIILAGIGIQKELLDFSEELAKKGEEEVDGLLTERMKRLDIPTKKDIDALNKNITELNKKLDEKERGHEIGHSHE